MPSSCPGKSLTLTGCFLAGVTSAAVVGWLLDRRRQNQRDQKSSSTSSSSNDTDFSSSSSSVTVPEHMRQEQLSRHALYFGNENMNLIRSSNVCVIGLGGVGSHCAMMLARGGVEYLRLIDFDQVTLSSLNRHACATLKDVGISKVESVKKVCLELGLKDENIDDRVEMYNTETGPTLLSTATIPTKEGEEDNKEQKWDVVIDCIDDVPTKAALLAYCIKNKIRVLSCMGAGGKSDMTRLHISDLQTAAKDPLASKLRQTMKKNMKKLRAEQEANGTGGEKKSNDEDYDENSYLEDMDQLTIIYSSEKTVAKLADFTDEQKAERDKSQFGAVDGMRIRVLPVLGPLPAIMGQVRFQ
jgi:tRNA A37 threonylcarbamoyladenosine dehydratase